MAGAKLWHGRIVDRIDVDFPSAFTTKFRIASKGMRISDQIRAFKSAVSEPDFYLCALVLGMAFILRLGGAVAFPNIHFPDEIYQSVEQAHRLAAGYGLVAWEYEEGIRFWGFPALLAGAIKLVLLGGGGPTGYLIAVQSVLAFLSLGIVFTAYRLGWRVGGTTGAVVAGTCVALWFELVYFGPKPLSEVAAASIFVLGLYLATSQADEDHTPRRLFLAGVLLGMAVYVRIQLAPAAAAATIILAGFHWRARWAPLVAGGVFSVMLGGLVDWFTWGSFLHSPIYNYHFNITQRVASKFGVDPWYWYFEALWSKWQWVGVPVLGLALLAGRRFPAMLVAAAVILATHIAIDHKEYRFIFPAIALLIVLAAIGLAEVVSRLSNRQVRCVTALTVVVFWGIASATLAASPAFRGNWWAPQPLLSAFAFLRDRADLCGLGLVDYPWYATGGYTYLHRDVPFYDLGRADEGKLNEESARGFNYLLARANTPQIPPGYELQACWGGAELACIYKRPQSCMPQAGSVKRRCDPPPRGSYRESCTNVHQRGPILSAQCRNLGGQLSEVQLDLRSCPTGNIENLNGRLVCRGSSRRHC